jgi:hypothetical protein
VNLISGVQISDLQYHNKVLKLKLKPVNDRYSKSLEKIKDEQLQKSTIKSDCICKH